MVGFPSRLFGGWRPGDLDGFLALGLDNLIQILLILGLCRTVLGYPDSLLFGVILPATGLSLLVGNVAYANQALQLARREQRDDCTALPYGINTISLLTYVFLVMLPVKLAALGDGLSEAEAITRSWRAGVMACLGSGLIEVAGALLVSRLQRWLPRAALLSTLAGIALGFLVLAFFLRTYSFPLIGLSSLAVILVGYFGRVRWPLPTGLSAVLIGAVLAWGSGMIQLDQEAVNNAFAEVGLHLPALQLSTLWLGRAELIPWLGIILPMGLFNVIGSLQNLESAAAAGDRYPTRPALLIDGTGTLLAAVLGSCFPTTIYIGHPAWKALGARSGYSVLNGLVMATGCLLGLFGLMAEVIPIEAGMAIVLFVGIAVSAQAFQATPARHAPAVVVGLLPGLAGWGAHLLKAGLRAGGAGTAAHPFGPDLVKSLAGADVWANGLFALEQGQIITAMLLAAMLVDVIEQRFLAAAATSALASLLAWFGVIHAWTFSVSDTTLNLGWGTGQPWAIGYSAVTLVMLIAHWLPQQTET